MYTVSFRYGDTGEHEIVVDTKETLKAVALILESNHYIDKFEVFHQGVDINPRKAGIGIFPKWMDSHEPH